MVATDSRTCRSKRNVLTVAGSDSSAGAGVQADLKTFAAFRVYGCSAVTALTAQNTRAVNRVVPVSASLVEDQMEAVFADVPIAAVKIGLLPNARVVRAVARVLMRRSARNVVFDPVMAAGTGAALQQGSALRAVLEALLRVTTVVTPNVAELARLTATPPARGHPELERAARLLLSRGPTWVLATGGHLPKEDCRDVLCGPGEFGDVRWYGAPRVATRHGHGTGCTLSSAIAARLAVGDDVPAAVGAAKSYVGKALAAAGELNAGRGPGPLNHFFEMWSRG